MTTAKGEATRSRILEAAVDLLVAGGVERLNLDDVLRTTRTSKGQLFHYFPGGKDELCQAATQRQVERLVEHSTPTSLGTWEEWEQWFGRTIELHRQQTEADSCEVAALAGRALDSNPRDRTVIGHAVRQWHEYLLGELTTMQARGLLTPQAPVSELAALVLAALEGGAVLDKATGSTQYLTQALQQTMSVLRSHAN